MRVNVTNLIKESEKILVTRRSPEERKKNQAIAIQKQIQQYIKNGNIGDLNLGNSPITSLPDNLVVRGDLNLIGTPISSLPSDLKVGGEIRISRTPLDKEHTLAQIYAMVPGFKGRILGNPLLHVGEPGMRGLAEEDTAVKNIKYQDSANEISQRIKSFFPEVHIITKKNKARVKFIVPDADGSIYTTVICGEFADGFFAYESEYTNPTILPFRDIEDLVRHIEQYTQVERPN